MNKMEAKNIRYPFLSVRMPSYAIPFTWHILLLLLNRCWCRTNLFLAVDSHHTRESTSAPNDFPFQFSPPIIIQLSRANAYRNVFLFSLVCQSDRSKFMRTFFRCVNNVCALLSLLHHFVVLWNVRKWIYKSHLCKFLSYASATSEYIYISTRLVPVINMSHSYGVCVIGNVYVTMPFVGVHSFLGLPHDTSNVCHNNHTSIVKFFVYSMRNMKKLSIDWHLNWKRNSAPILRYATEHSNQYCSFPIV